MDRRAFLRRASVAALGAAAGCLGSDDDPAFSNPVFEPTLADPSIVRADDGSFYAYGTEDDWYSDDEHPADGVQFVPVARSEDLVEWEYVGEAFETKPDWKDSGGLWAPHVDAYDDRYYLYYAYSVWGDDNPGIGVATADHPAGPFEDRGKLFDSEEIGVENSIDPFFFVEEGTPYLFWGSWHGIWGVELEDDGFAVAGEPFRIAADDHFEAPYIVERDGRYYFFGSNGRCCDGADSDYHAVVGRSDSFDGPYVNRDGDPLEENPGTTILEGSDAFIGPGHNAVIRDDAGTDWLVYHAYDADDPWINSTPRRALMIDRIRWEDGWPAIDGGVPSEEARTPVIED
ncbi:family 43 glycosylhydrolase [Natronococcus wangiae]|uniref:family 43 glycosylhydrolase n=1 Tax=Natronococcus wangiae TaxID=3068275 RepID=UPI00273D7C2B|nr:family 43 glycosylhydrolase [Natronococcus sp. AD5]